MKKLLFILLSMFLLFFFLSCKPITKYNLTITIVGEGIVSANNIFVTNDVPMLFDENIEIEFKTEPALGWKFDRWSGANSSDISSNKIIINSDKVIIATFIPYNGTNSDPKAFNVLISGTAQVTQTLTGIYTYKDLENDEEGISTFRWLSSDTETGTYSIISGATSITYILQPSDENKYVKFEVTPVAQTGTLIGTPVQSETISQVISSSAVAIVSNKSILSEATANNGSLNPNTITITLNNSTFVQPQVTLVNITANLPDGLSLANPTYVDTDHITIDIEGNATNHQNINDTTFQITIELEAITGATTSLNTGMMFIDFSDNSIYTLTIGIFPTEAMLDNCTISFNPNTYPIFYEGQVVTMTVIPGDNWGFSSWYGEILQGTGPYTITMNSDKTLYATFVPTTNGDTFYEDFEGPNTIWGNLTSGNNWSLWHGIAPVLQGTEVHNGTQAVRFGNINSTVDYSLFEICLEDLSSEKALTFWYKKNSGSPYHYLCININNIGLISITDDSTEWKQAHLPLSVGNNSISFYFITYGPTTTNTNNCWIDDITLETANPDLKVYYETNLIPHDSGGMTPFDIGNVYDNYNFSITLYNEGTGTLNISDITLTGGGPEITIVTPTPTTIAPFEYEVVLFKATPTGGPYTSGLITINSNDTDIPAYEFVLLCDVTGIPTFFENFESTDFPPTGWTSFDIDGDETEWARETTITNNKSAGSAYHSYGNNEEGWLVTPAIDLTGKTSATLRFWKCAKYEPYEYHGVWVSTTSNNPTGGSFVEIQELGGGNLIWNQTEIDLSAYVGNSTVYIGFKYTGNNAQELYIDDVGVISN